jgi:PIN domain nuclease of toxin-antitoxin system
MRLLLDTNVLIHLLEGRLAGRLHETLAAPETEIYASVASLWEIAIKSRVGKLRLTVPLQQLPNVINATGASLLSINAAHVLALPEPEPEPATRDPFDRLLLAQCMVEGLRLVTLDRALVSHPLSWQTA